MAKTRTQTTPTFEQMKAFLLPRYKHERLYGRDVVGGAWADYGDNIVRGRVDYLKQYGLDCISRHESVTGSIVWYQFLKGQLKTISCETARAILTERRIVQ